jgi:hypothetical protein
LQDLAQRDGQGVPRTIGFWKGVIIQLHDCEEGAKADHRVAADQKHVKARKQLGAQLLPDVLPHNCQCTIVHIIRLVARAVLKPISMEAVEFVLENFVHLHGKRVSTHNLERSSLLSRWQTDKRQEGKTVKKWNGHQVAHVIDTELRRMVLHK